jgi:hypothetical protein
VHGIACKQERQYASGTKCSRRCMAAYSHTQPLRNSRIKKLRHGIFDFGLRNYGIRSWGGARKRFQVPNPHDSRLLCVRPPVPCDLPPAPRPTSRTQGHAQLRSVAAGATMHFVHVWHRTNLLSSVRAARGRFHASRYMPRIDGFTRRVPAAGAPEGLRNYGEAAAAALKTLKKLRRGSRFLFS